MGIFQRLERSLDSMVNGSFSRAFKSELQPVELASALRQEMDRQANAVDGRTTVPSHYLFELAHDDFARLERYAQELVAELAHVAGDYSREQRYVANRPFSISLRLGPAELTTGTLRIHSDDLPGTPASMPVVNQPAPARLLPSLDTAPVPRLISTDGKEYRLESPVLVIGRAPECGVQIQDGSVSRQHATLMLGTEVLIRDMGSTNGTMVDGVRVAEAPLHDGSIIKLGSIVLTYRSR